MGRLAKFRPVANSFPSRTNSFLSHSSRNSRLSPDDDVRGKREFSRSYAEILSIIDELNGFVMTPVSHPSVAGKIDRLKGLFLSSLSPSEQDSLRNYLKKNICGKNFEVVPGTVGAVLCGCFNDTNPNTPLGCLATCAGNFIEPTEKCEETVLFWSMIGGKPHSEVLSRGNGTCRVNVVDGFPNLDVATRDRLLAENGCSSAVFYNAKTGQPLYQQVNSKTYALPTTATVASVETPTLPKPAPVSPAVPTQRNNGWWWIVAIFFFLILIGIIMFVYLRHD